MEFSTEQRTRLEKELQSFEELRLDEVKRLKSYEGKIRYFKYVYRAAVIGGIPSVILPFLLPITGPIILLAIALFIIELILYHKVYKKPGEAYESQFKENIMQLVFEYINPNLKYQPYSGFSEDTVKSMRLFTQKIESQYVEDFCEGSVLDVDMRFCEASMYSTRRTKKTVALGCLFAIIGLFRDGEADLETSETYLFFRGLLLQLDFHKDFKGQVYTIPQATYQKKMSNMGQFHGAKPSTSGYPDFDEYYKVFTTDEVLLHYVITPAMAERINRMREKFDSDISLSFLNGKLNMAIGWNKDLFEIDIHKGVPSIEEFIILGDEIKIFEEILVDLAQDRRIWGEKAMG